MTFDGTNVNESKVSNVINENIGFTLESVNNWANAHLELLKSNADSFTMETRRNNYFKWLTDPTFDQNETLIFAKKIISDNEESVTTRIFNAARNFVSAH
jgi:hypothetical protein